MRRVLIIIFFISTIGLSAQTYNYDVVIVGGTPAGITAAIAAAREGMSCVILERSQHIGGLPVNGLGATDIATRGATTGLFAEFVALNRAYYSKTYGNDSPQERDCSDGYHFEPSVAAMTFEKMIHQKVRGKITVLTMRQFNTLSINSVTGRGGVFALFKYSTAKLK